MYDEIENNSTTLFVRCNLETELKLTKLKGIEKKVKKREKLKLM